MSVTLGLTWERVLDLSPDRIELLVRERSREQARQQYSLLLYMHLTNNAAQGSRSAHDAVSDLLDKLNETIDG